MTTEHQVNYLREVLPGEDLSGPTCPLCGAVMVNDRFLNWIGRAGEIPKFDLLWKCLSCNHTQPRKESE